MRSIVHLGPAARILSTGRIASRRSSSRSPSCLDTNRTHHPRASERPRATSADTSVSRVWRSLIRNLVMKGTARRANVPLVLLHSVPHETLRPKCASAWVAMATPSSPCPLGSVRCRSSSWCRRQKPRPRRARHRRSGTPLPGESARNPDHRVCRQDGCRGARRRRRR